jgi:hypothetical protein
MIPPQQGLGADAGTGFDVDARLEHQAQLVVAIERVAEVVEQHEAPLIQRILRLRIDGHVARQVEGVQRGVARLAQHAKAVGAAYLERRHADRRRGHMARFGDDQRALHLGFQLGHVVGEGDAGRRDQRELRRRHVIDTAARTHFGAYPLRGVGDEFIEIG